MISDVEIIIFEKETEFIADRTVHVFISFTEEKFLNTRDSLRIAPNSKAISPGIRLKYTGINLNNPEYWLFVFNKEDAVRFLSSHEYPLSEIKMSLETAIAWEKLLF